ncbi:putative porin [Flavobacterium sp. WW92]|uniref:putative porin n=1 Tax=unclassified Flavobacterium TaxID=196869 RepID=UPI002224C0AF|nr:MULTISPECIES: putative porin [unclassified Flavobacterium]WDO13146.1 putative porin [Flavobacterium sp. WW92]
MAKFFYVAIFLLPLFALAQEKDLPTKENVAVTNKAKKSKLAEPSKNDSIATIDLYKIITLQHDTTYVDTSLTIQKEYKFNYLRKDNFGLLPFSNEGQTFNTLQYGLNKSTAYPSFGFAGKHFNYLEVDDIKYYNVATPMTELYFKTVMEQGQMIDAFITLNTSERLNFSIGYRGLRSLGKYVNQLSSNGNFKFMTSYNTSNERYFLKAHFTGQDLTNGENGGIVSLEDFEGGDSEFDDRARLDVYSLDATSILKGNRYFFDHYFRINKEKGGNNLYINHQFNYENKFFEYTQPTIITTITTPAQGTIRLSRFGTSYRSSNINDKTRYNRMYNKVGATYENSTLGQFQFFIEDFRYNYFYNRIIVNPTNTVQNLLSDEFNVVGGQYTYQKNNWNGRFLFSSSISDQKMSTLDANLSYKFDDRNNVHFQYQNLSKVPDHLFNLFQSSYVDYNWSNNFKNEKINSLTVNANTQWASASLQVSSLKNHLYFFNESTVADTLTVKPGQYSKTINYISLKVSKEFKFRKWALDNTVLYQKADQEDDILNVPQLVTRNTLYYSDHLFKKALFLQTGITFSYFSKFYANDYNPVIGDFYIQNQREIGGFPTFDFFINAKIRQTRVYLKAEHFNSSFTGNDFYSAPNYPYRDFIVRFGLVWNFFS